MKVTITGAGGFIGRHLVADQLRRGHQVTAIDLRVAALQPHREHPGLRIVQGDFTDRQLIAPWVQRRDVVFHLAGLHLETGVSDGRYWQVNVQGTRQLVEACFHLGVGRFVHCSSVGVYGDVLHPPACEETECHPDIVYEQTKLAGEAAIRAFADDYGYPVTIVRPAWVYGPGCPRTAKLFRTIQKGRFFFVGDGQTLRHPIYVQDMVCGFEVAARHERAPGQTYVMAGPRAVTLRELVGEIARCSGVPAPRLRLPRMPVWVGCYGLEKVFGALGREAPFTRRSLKFYMGNSAFTTTKAREQLGFEPQTDLPKGLALTYAWLKSSPEDSVRKRIR